MSLSPFPLVAHRRAMLIAARSSNDFACCFRAPARARSKYASPFAVSGCDETVRFPQQCDLPLARTTFLWLFRWRHCFVNAAPSVIELVQAQHRPCQILEIPWHP